MRLLILLFAVRLLAATPAEEIRGLLDRQVTDWNRGDVRAFMQGYEDSEETTYAGTTVVKGYQRTLERYLDRYPTRQVMGTLRFSDIDIRLLGSDYACALGKFHLERPESAGGNASGIFSLVLRKTPKGWKIILDHTGAG
jgi:ketosteroid isomerase-like protein